MSASNKQSPLFVLSGGGTGGHVYPSLAVAAALARVNSTARIAYVGSPDGMEGDLVRRESTLPFWQVDAAAVRDRGRLTLIANVWRLLRGVGQALQLIRRERPAAIFGTGGYVCVPLFVAAWLMRVPSAIYLPDVVPGLAVRLLSRIATVTLASIPDAATHVGLPVATLATWQPSRTALVVTGYPVRADIQQGARETTRAMLGIHDDMPLLLVYGGSRGARSINFAVAARLNDILPHAAVLHICGREGDEAPLRTMAAALPPALQARYHLHPYLAMDGALTMPAALVAADVTICRSGASVLGELPAAGLPAILVPYPYVHQDENADYLVRHGAAIKVADAQQTDALWPALAPLLHDPSTRMRYQQAMQHLATPDAATNMAHILQRLAGEG
jgi:UDP-N-acetylglucosamine--N-acetylmuramyl-(pentapeptide) pyrophosphoryl-undecaprenol N-acetylglucosamine transferase